MNAVSEALPMTSQVQKNLHKMNGFELAYKLALLLNALYSSGGYSLGRSTRSALLDLFMTLNKGLDVQTLPVFNYAEPVRRRVADLIHSASLHKTFEGRICIRNRKILSAVVLHKLQQEYVRGMVEASKLVSEGKITDADHSFQSLFPLYSLLYDIYLRELGLSVEKVIQFAKRYDQERIRKLIAWTPEQLRG